MKRAVVSTSANPFHFGHLDIFNKAKQIFDDVQVVVAQNSNKDESKNLAFHLNAYNIPYTIIKEKTIADYCFENEINYIVRGIRNGVDAEYELKLDFANKEINPKIQTVFIPTNDVYSNISSSTIRELLKYKKYDIVKKYMNQDAMWRYVNGKKYICYFGKSCVGKTTYLKANYTNLINVDFYLWQVSKKVHGQYATDKFKEDSRHLIYSDKFSAQEKIVIFKNENISNPFFTDAFWSQFFSTDNIAFDWATVGFYYDLIPVKYRSQIQFVELTTSEENRIERIKNKKFEDKIKYLDSLYCKPIIVDKVRYI